MEKRFSAKKADIADTTRVQNVQSGVKSPGINPSQVLVWHLAVGEVAKIAPGVTCVCNGNVAKGGAAVPDQAQHVPDFCRRGRHRQILLPTRTGICINYFEGTCRRRDGPRFPNLRISAAGNAE